MADSKSVAPSSIPSEKAQPFFYARPNGDGSQFTAGGNGVDSTYPPSDFSAQNAYEKGLSEGKAAARAEFEKSVAELRSQISGAVRSFSKERADYFCRVEMEVVRLSLSIARKILHRESQLDPLVLTGVVHVALQKLNSETRVTIRARHEDVRFWKEYFKQSEDVFSGVNVMADPSLLQGHVVLETEFGTTEISFDMQLKEIEQGFFDLLEQRPKGQP